MAIIVIPHSRYFIPDVVRGILYLADASITVLVSKTVSKNLHVCICVKKEAFIISSSHEIVHTKLSHL